jgi:hypothetical protein
MEDGAMAVVRLDFDRRHDRGYDALPSRKRVGHHLLFVVEDSIETVVRHLRRQRFDVEVRRDGDGRCTIAAVHSIVPTSAVMEQVTEFFEDIARDHSGEYVGWVVVAEGGE